MSVYSFSIPYRTPAALCDGVALGRCTVANPSIGSVHGYTDLGVYEYLAALRVVFAMARCSRRHLVLLWRISDTIYTAECSDARFEVLGGIPMQLAEASALLFNKIKGMATSFP